MFNSTRAHFFSAGSALEANQRRVLLPACLMQYPQVAKEIEFATCVCTQYPRPQPPPQEALSNARTSANNAY